MIRNLMGMGEEPVLVTAEGLARLKSDLETARAQRREAADRMKEAAQPGDIEDNPEFEQAKEEVASLDNRIYELEESIARAQIIEEHHTGVVEPGSTIEVQDSEGTVETWHLVGAVEADPVAGKISVESPAGRALLGKRRGDTVTVNAPSGVVEFTVNTIR